MTNRPRRQRGLYGQTIIDASDQPIVRIARLAAGLARRHMSDYAHKYASKKFTQPQPFACIILKAHMGCTSRKAEEILTLMPAVGEAIGLEAVPRFTTLQTFAARPEIAGVIDAVLASIGRAIAAQLPQDAAVDGTGMETTSASAHFVSRAGRERTRDVKLMLGVLCASAVAALPLGSGAARPRPVRPGQLLAASLCITLATLSGCEKRPVAPAPVPVLAKTLTPEKIILSRRFSGSIEPLQTTSLAFKLSGTVRGLYRPPGMDRDVQVGDMLAKGTVIAGLDEGDRRAHSRQRALLAEPRLVHEEHADCLAVPAARRLQLLNKWGALALNFSCAPASWCSWRGRGRGRRSPCGAARGRPRSARASRRTRGR